MVARGMFFALTDEHSGARHSPEPGIGTGAN